MDEYIHSINKIIMIILVVTLPISFEYYMVKKS